MPDLTALTLAEARDGLRRRSFSALELAEAHIAAIAQARALNAYVLETPEAARAMAQEADRRIAGGAARLLDVMGQRAQKSCAVRSHGIRAVPLRRSEIEHHLFAQPAGAARPRAETVDQPVEAFQCRGTQHIDPVMLHPVPGGLRPGGHFAGRAPHPPRRALFGLLRAGHGHSINRTRQRLAGRVCATFPA